MSDAVKEKKQVAGLSVIAAIFLTGFKLIVGITTGSLGVLSEALHSGLDLIAAVITWFAVKISDSPADDDHQYGHGKIENLSALIETLLLLITCSWIVYEAVDRLTSGNAKIEVTIWSYIVIISSIIIDISRSRALSRVAKKHNSQALEADALHFSTDIWSSAVVLLGLICANFGYYLADSIAALGVAMIVVYVSVKLGRRAVDALLDRAPLSLHKQIVNLLSKMPEIRSFHDLRLRSSGADHFVDVTIHVDPDISIVQAHEVSHKVEELIRSEISRCTVQVHYEPDEKGE
ncbi:MAG: cation transporter [Bacteroidetes bacterium HGW-Bacteroidetes-9]|jgi:cation diffusion facilitator family transporter|nr:MAG: cation transporter [Bacteroidetes bacterium HGW-Bacteroidetes-9]